MTGAQNPSPLFGVVLHLFHVLAGSCLGEHVVTVRMGVPDELQGRHKPERSTGFPWTRRFLPGNFRSTTLRLSCARGYLFLGQGRFLPSGIQVPMYIASHLFLSSAISLDLDE